MTEDELAALRREVSELKATINKPAPAPIDWDRRIAEHNAQLHQMRERRMAHASNFHPDDLRAMEAACPTSAVKDIVAHGTVQSPSMSGTSGAVTGVHLGGNAPVNTSGYVDPRPLGPQPGIDLIDRAVNAALPHGPEWGKGNGPEWGKKE